MRTLFLSGIVGAAALIVASQVAERSGKPLAGGEVTMTSPIEIPKSIKTEHSEIHEALVEATRAPGRVGAAARALAAVLHPHFVREEEIALPPLGMLARLVAGERPSGDERSKLLAMTDSLRNELPWMLQEHKRIRAAVDGLWLAAEADAIPKYQRLAEQLALHALTEEEVLYPAAILVGDLVRMQTTR